MFKSNKLILIASRGNRSARISYNPLNGKDKNKLVGEVENGGNMAALQLVNYTIGQLIESGFNGRATIVTHDSVAARAYSYRKAVNEDKDPVTEMVNDKMSDEYILMVEEFVQALNDAADLGAEIRFVKMKNLHVWDLRKDEKFVPVTDENRELIGTTLDFVDGVAGEYVAQTNLLNGKYVLTTHTERIERTNVECLALVRPANSISMTNVLKAEEAVWSLCPDVEIDFDDFDETDAI